MASGTITINWPFSLKSSVAETITDKTIDELLTPGVYYIVQNTGSDLKLPEGVNGIVIVISDAGENRIKQFYTRWGTAGSNDGNIYMRRITNKDTFGPWWRLTGEKSWDVATETSPDSITDPGMYYVKHNTDLPEGTDGFLWVIRVGPRTKQIYSRFGTKGTNDGNIYIRDNADSAHAYNSYGSWWLLTGEKMPSGYTYTNGRGYLIPNNTSLQDIVEVGTYYSPNTTVTSTLTGRPTGSYGAGFTLKVERVGGVYRRVFIDGRAADSRQFIQNFTDATTYADWYRVELVNESTGIDNIIVETFTMSAITITASQAGHGTFTCSKTGYTPIGIVGFTKNGTGTSWAIPYEWNISGTTGHLRLRNFYSGDISVGATVYVLMRKNY